MSIPRKKPCKQSHSVPRAKKSHGTGDDPQDLSPGTTPPESGTIGQCRPVPCTLSVLFEDVDPAALTAFLEGAPLARPPGTSPLPPPQTCPTCGRAYDLFDHDTSRLLDWVERLHQDIHPLKAAVEEVLP